MNLLYVLLLIIAAACFAYAAFAHKKRHNVDAVASAAGSCLHDDVKFVAAGLLAYTLVPLIQHLDRLV